jgi:hypothetical protein
MAASDLAMMARMEYWYRLIGAEGKDKKLLVEDEDLRKFSLFVVGAAPTVCFVR